MKIILLKDSGKLGKEGDTVQVKDGYARNYLIPCGLALEATDKSFKRLQEIKKARSKTVEKEKQKFLKIKESVGKISLTITVEAKEDEKLYGAIGEAQILKLLGAEGVELEKGKIDLSEPIDKLGVYNLKVELHPEVEASFRVWVVKK